VTWPELLSLVRHRKEDRPPVLFSPQKSWAISEKAEYSRSVGECEYLITQSTPVPIRSHNRSYYASNRSYMQEFNEAMEAMSAITIGSSLRPSESLIKATGVHDVPLLGRGRVRRQQQEEEEQPECEVPIAPPLKVKEGNVEDRIALMMAEKEARSLSWKGPRHGGPAGIDDSSSEGSDDEMEEGEGREEAEKVERLLNARHRELSDEERSVVRDALARPHNDSLLIQTFNINMTRLKMSCLTPSKCD
jgi:hypothetical protein